ncbi:MAG: YdbH domain-containing protein [Pseudomonadales bacterium]
MRRLFLLIALTLLTLAALWFLTPRWLPHAIAALLPDNFSLQSVEADKPGRNRWTIQTLKVEYTSQESSQPAQAEPARVYDVLHRGPIDDLNTLLANYQIDVKRLEIAQSDTIWQGSAQLGEGLFTARLAGELDSHRTLFSADINLHERVLDGEISIGDMVQVTANVKPSTSTLDGGSETRLDFSVDAAFTDLLLQENQALQFGVPAQHQDQTSVLSATSAELHINGALNYEDQAFVLTLAQNSHTVMQNLRAREIYTPRFRAALRAPAQLTLRENEQLLAPLRFTSNNVLVSYQDTDLPRFRLTGDVSLHNSIASGTVHIASRITELSEQITVSVPFSHRLDSGLGRGTIHSTPIRFNEQQRFLPSIVPNWQWPADLVGGSLSLSGQLNWNKSTQTATARVDLNDIDSFYQEMLVRGINGAVTLNWPETSAEFEVTAEELQAGMVMNNLMLSADFSDNDLLLKTVQLSVFGGKLRATDINLDPQNIEFKSIIELENMNLGELLSVEQGIEGAGTIDGELPIAVAGRILTMNNGAVKARQPGGVIRYTGTVPLAAIESSPELRLAVDALKNFHYKVLDINASYAENGKMTLAVRLEGRNPDMKNSRPINFNLNVTEDVPSLIKSLMLTREISDGLQKRIEQSQR